jgi:hypothetical protein
MEHVFALIHGYTFIPISKKIGTLDSLGVFNLSWLANLSEFQVWLSKLCVMFVTNKVSEM